MTASFDNPHGNIDYVKGVATGTPFGPFTVRVTSMITDLRDHATYTAVYLLHVHDQWENKRRSGAPIDRYDYYIPLQENTNAPMWVNGPGTGTFSQSVTHTFGAAVNVTGGLSVDELATFEVGAQQSYEISKSYAVGATSQNIPAGYHTFPYIMAHHTDSTYSLDKYDAFGFVGTFPQTVPDPGSWSDSIGWGHIRRIDEWDTDI